jgi:hypothetical protein
MGNQGSARYTWIAVFTNTIVSTALFFQGYKKGIRDVATRVAAY